MGQLLEFQHILNAIAKSANAALHSARGAGEWRWLLVIAEASVGKRTAPMP